MARADLSSVSAPEAPLWRSVPSFFIYLFFSSSPHQRFHLASKVCTKHKCRLIITTATCLPPSWSTVTCCRVLVGVSRLFLAAGSTISASDIASRCQLAFYRCQNSFLAKFIYQNELLISEWAIIMFPNCFQQVLLVGAIATVVSKLLTSH